MENITKQIENVKRDIRNYEKKIKQAPKEKRAGMKIDVKKFRSRIRSVESKLDT
jgi:hypothetical protein